jgi:hypothetical protein
MGKVVAGLGRRVHARRGLQLGQQGRAELGFNEALGAGDEEAHSTNETVWKRN